VTNDLDPLPTHLSPHGLCPRCGRSSNFVTATVAQVSAEEVAAVLTCAGCTHGVVVVTRGDVGVHWYPAPGVGTLDPAVDTRLAGAYDEGARCLSIGAPRAAAVMFRSVLSLFVKAKGSTEAKAERHLKAALKIMKEGGSLHPSLWDWADHLNQLGNEGAHPEDYDDVTQAEATELSQFVRHLLTLEYEMPARISRARAAAGQPRHD